jgi:hypothetical protein
LWLIINNKKNRNMTKALAVVGGIVLVLIIYHLWKTRKLADNSVANRGGEALGIAGTMVNRPKPSVVATMIEGNVSDMTKRNPPQVVFPQSQIGNGQIGTPSAPASWNNTSARMESAIVVAPQRGMVVCHGLYGQPLYHGTPPCKSGYQSK